MYLRRFRPEAISCLTDLFLLIHKNETALLDSREDISNNYEFTSEESSKIGLVEQFWPNSKVPNGPNS